MRGSSASARVQIVVAHKGQLYLLPAPRPAKFERIARQHGEGGGLTRSFCLRVPKP